MNKKVIFFAVLLTGLFSSCLSFIENQSEQYLHGEWIAVTMQNGSVGEPVDINPHAINYILGKKQGDAIYFNSDKTFTVFSQKSGLGSGTPVSGTYEMNVLTLKLSFYNEPTITREILSIGDLEMVMQDTIFGSPVTIAYNQ
ncbi:MAG TPA: hypothetical protein PLU49_10295 [Saprospiraceae bacterium]|nr:hypothetical protein [Saprospiraceae bacterium]